MAHDIATVNGKSAFSFAKSGGLPWHGLGQGVDKAANSAEAMQLGGLDWQVESKPLFALSPEGEQLKTDLYGHYRLDTVKGYVHLGSVKGRYEIVQNAECFDWMDSLLMDGIVKYETAGALGQGERIFMSAKMKGNFKVADSEIEKYLLLFNSHDGSSGIEAIPTTVRVVCANTLAMARGGKVERIKFRHTATIKDRMAQASRLMDASNGDFQAWFKIAQAMAKKKTTAVDAEKIFSIVYPKPAEGSKIAQGRHDERMARLWAAWKTEPTNANIKDTAWGILNAVTFLEDHADDLHQCRGGYENETHAIRKMEGKGALAKIEAWEAIAELVA